jgi:DNA-binding transcriptional regulator YiaG
MTYYKCERISTMPRGKGVSNQPAIQAVEAAALNVAAIRAKALLDPGGPCLTQENFARAIGVPVGTLRQWEQGRRQPTGAARVLLANRTSLRLRPP